MTALTEDRPDWQAHANCIGIDPELFFPGRGETDTVAEAKEVCAGCSVREACLEYALTHVVKFGIWGGLSEKERRRIRMARAKQRAVAR